jgi:hypothetical protein
VTIEQVDRGLDPAFLTALVHVEDP